MLVVGLALVLLMIVFRSLLVPLTAVIGFLLTIVATLGVVVFVFQQGHLGSLFGVQSKASIISFLPILVTAILLIRPSDWSRPTAVEVKLLLSEKSMCGSLAA